jgi:molybdate transport system substrate-binding protein
MTGTIWRGVLAIGCALAVADPAAAVEPLIIAASPSVRGPVEALGRAFEAAHPDVRVRIYLDSGLDLRRVIASVENSMVGQYFTGGGPIHLVAPGGDELIDRLEEKRYVAQGTKQAYAVERLVLIVPEQLVEGPESFTDLTGKVARLAVADPLGTDLGRQTTLLLDGLGYRGTRDVATDARGVLDHVLGGQADAGIIFGHDAVKEQQRVRVAATAETGYRPTRHSMAMERSCPRRTLCEQFLAFLSTPAAQAAVRQAGYAIPSAGRGADDR